MAGNPRKRTAIYRSGEEALAALQALDSDDLSSSSGDDSESSYSDCVPSEPEDETSSSRGSIANDDSSSDQSNYEGMFNFLKCVGHFFFWCK